MTISVVVVHYKNQKEVESFVFTLLESSCSVNVVIVDNSRDLREEILQHLVNVRIVRPSSNQGYLSGLLFGSSYFEKFFGESPPHIIFCNTDISVPDSTLRAIESASYAANVGVICPRIINLNGINQNPFLKKPISVNALRLRSVIFGSQWLATIYRYLASIKEKAKRYLVTQNARKQVLHKKIEIFAGHGSFFVVTRKMLNVLANCESIPFLYGEEIFIGIKAQRNGLKIIYDSRLNIKHFEHTSTSKLSKSRQNRLMSEALDVLLFHAKQGCPRSEYN